MDNPIWDGKVLAESPLAAGTEARGTSSQQAVAEVEWSKMG